MNRDRSSNITPRFLSVFEGVMVDVPNWMVKLCWNHKQLYLGKVELKVMVLHPVIFQCITINNVIYQYDNADLIPSFIFCGQIDIFQNQCNSTNNSTKINPSS